MNIGKSDYGFVWAVRRKDDRYMKILIGADLVPTESNMDLFENGSAMELVGKDLLQLMSDPANYCIFNLEVPLSDIAMPIAKNGPNLIAPTKAVAGYNALGVNLLTLANNHILDQGKQGLQSTCNVLREHGIDYLGIGATLEEAAKPYIFCFSGRKVGVYACTEHEFSVVQTNMMGANPFEPLETPDHIAELKKQCDYVIVLYHGGKEHYRYPSPGLQKICRKLVEKGADLVICQHSHCIGCEEKYGDGTIVYGQGNFLFDHRKDECWQTGLLIQLDSEMNISYLPLAKDENTVRLATDQKARSILDDFEKRSVEIVNPGMVEQKYSEYSNRMLIGYIYSLRGKQSVIFKALNRLSGNRMRGWFLGKVYGKKEQKRIQNIFECESLHELVLWGLKHGGNL